MKEAHFARVVPIVGESLRRVRVALIGLPEGVPIVELLAASGVGRWVWAADEAPARGAADDALREALLARHGEALELDAVTLPPQAWATAMWRHQPDLLIAVGGAGRHRYALQAATTAQVPALLIAPPTISAACRAAVVFPGDDPVAVSRWIGALDEDTAGERPAAAAGDYEPGAASWDWVTAAPLCTGLARAILLRDTPHRRADLAKLWDAGVRALTIGAASPLDIAWTPLPGVFVPTASTPPATANQLITPSPPHPFTPSPPHRLFHTPVARRGRLLIAGLGSLGSVAALHLVEHAAGLVIADPDRVDSYNPVRQAYPRAAIGRLKVEALRDELRAAGATEVLALDVALADEREVTALVERHGVSAALIATGAAADFAIARALRACDVPHVAGRCYPRARYWEAIVVDARRNAAGWEAGPALSDLRGHLYLGPAPPPTPEQIAAYSDAGALEAEPATLIESGWAAAWMARLTAQLLAPTGLRERWLLELLACGRTCLVGGIGVERTPDGPAYGVALPGEIHGWGRGEIEGAG